MWVVIKKKKNCMVKHLKSNLKKLFSAEPLVYSPKILQYNIIGNKFKEKNYYVLGNYILIFHERLKDTFFFNKLNFVEGVDIVLKGFKHSQQEIKFFVNRCKENENKKGYLIQDFFINNLTNNIKFCSGPFVNFAINLIEVQKHKISVLAGKYKILVNKRKNFITSC